jgi:hypothetical protein
VRRLEKMEEECEAQLERISEGKENRRYQMHEMMERMIEDTIQG